MTVSTQDAFNVGDLMTGDIISLGPADTVERAQELLTTNTLHLLPIVKDSLVVGAVTLADCHGLAADTAVGDAVTRRPVTAEVTMAVAEAADLMRAEGVHHLLVTEAVDGADVLVGVLSSLDLLKLLVP